MDSTKSKSNSNIVTCIFDNIGKDPPPDLKANINIIFSSSELTFVSDSELYRIQYMKAKSKVTSNTDITFSNQITGEPPPMNEKILYVVKNVTSLLSKEATKMDNKIKNYLYSNGGLSSDEYMQFTEISTRVDAIEKDDVDVSKLDFIDTDDDEDDEDDEGDESKSTSAKISKGGMFSMFKRRSVDEKPLSRSLSWNPEGSKSWVSELSRSESLPVTSKEVNQLMEKYRQAMSEFISIQKEGKISELLIKDEEQEERQKPLIEQIQPMKVSATSSKRKHYTSELTSELIPELTNVEVEEKIQEKIQKNVQEIFEIENVFDVIEDLKKKHVYFESQAVKPTQYGVIPIASPSEETAAIEDGDDSRKVDAPMEVGVVSFGSPSPVTTFRQVGGPPFYSPYESASDLAVVTPMDFENAIRTPLPDDDDVEFYNDEDDDDETMNQGTRGGKTRKRKSNKIKKRKSNKIKKRKSNKIKKIKSNKIKKIKSNKIKKNTLKNKKNTLKYKKNKNKTKKNKRKY